MGKIEGLTDAQLIDMSWEAIVLKVREGDTALKHDIVTMCVDLAQLRGFMAQVITDVGEEMARRTFRDPPPTVQQVREWLHKEDSNE